MIYTEEEQNEFDKEPAFTIKERKALNLYLQHQKDIEYIIKNFPTLLIKLN